MEKEEEKKDNLGEKLDKLSQELNRITERLEKSETQENEILQLLRDVQYLLLSMKSDSVVVKYGKN